MKPSHLDELSFRGIASELVAISGPVDGLWLEPKPRSTPYEPGKTCLRQPKQLIAHRCSSASGSNAMRNDKPVVHQSTGSDSHLLYCRVF
jgi:hypothetical protein